MGRSHRNGSISGRRHSLAGLTPADLVAVTDTVEVRIIPKKHRSTSLEIRGPKAERERETIDGISRDSAESSSRGSYKSIAVLVEEYDALDSFIKLNETSTPKLSLRSPSSLQSPSPSTSYSATYSPHSIPSPSTRSPATYSSHSHSPTNSSSTPSPASNTKSLRSKLLPPLVVWGSGSSDSLKAFRKSPPKLFHMI